VFQHVEQEDRIDALRAEEGVEIHRFDIAEQDAIAPGLGQLCRGGIDVDSPDTTAACSQRTSDSFRA
jgi:hypothetical protein